MFEDESDCLDLEDLDDTKKEEKPQDSSNGIKGATLRSCGFKTPESPGKSRKRKFPGPAGILSESSSSLKNRSESTDEINDDNETLKQDNKGEVTDNADSEDLFGDIWREMMEDYDTSSDELDSYSVSKLKEESHPGSSKKTPILLVVIKSIDASAPDPTCSLADPSGFINGMIHRDVMEQYRAHLSVGSILVLRNVAVLMTLRNHYVNVTLNNLLSIYQSGASPRRIILCTSDHPLSISQILEESRLTSRIKDLNVSHSKKVDNPFVKSSSKSPSPLSYNDFQFKKPRPSPPPPSPPPPSVHAQPSVESNSEDDKLLEGLDEDSLFGDF